MATIVLTGKKGSTLQHLPSLIPSSSISIFITCRVSQARNEDAWWAKATCKNRLPKLFTAIYSDIAIHVLFGGLIGHTSLKLTGISRHLPGTSTWTALAAYPPLSGSSPSSRPSLGPGIHAQGEPTRYLRPAACKSHLSL